MFCTFDMYLGRINRSLNDYLIDEELWSGRRMRCQAIGNLQVDRSNATISVKNGLKLNHFGPCLDQCFEFMVQYVK